MCCGGPTQARLESCEQRTSADAGVAFVSRKHNTRHRYIQPDGCANRSRTSTAENIMKTNKAIALVIGVASSLLAVTAHAALVKWTLNDVQLASYNPDFGLDNRPS